MKALTPLFAFCLASLLPGQSPLTTLFDWTNGLTAAAAGRNVYFDLQVNNPITLQAIELNTTAALGAPGSVEVWFGNAGITTYLGNEQTVANWTLRASGTLTSAGEDQPTPVCLATPITLTPGSYAVAIKYIGVPLVWSGGNGTALPGSGNQSFANADVVVKCGASQATPFTSVPTNNVRWNGSLLYFPGTASLPCSALPAKNEGYGQGCQRFPASFYDLFLPAVPAATAAQVAATTLSNRSLSYVPSGTGYAVFTNLGGVAFQTPSGAATTLTGFLPNADDGEVTVTLAQPFTHPGGTTPTLNVHSNGIVSVGPIEAAIAPSFFPFVADLLAAPTAAWYAWHDYNPGEAGSGQIQFEQSGGIAFVTWNAVESYPTAVQNRSTLQFQFDTSSGQVNIVWGTVTPVGFGNDASDIHLVGYSPAGASIDHGDGDVTTLTTPLFLDGTLDRLPLALRASARAAFGSNVVFTTSNETASTTPVGLLILSLADLPGLSPVGLDLAVIGAPGCFVNVDPSVAPVINLLTTSVPNGMQSTLAIPSVPSAAGLQWFCQSVWFDPSVNTFGLLTSNAIKQTIGSW